MILLFSDYSARDPYVGQVKAVLAQQAAGVAVIDLLHDAPAFNAHAGAHLLDALAQSLPLGAVCFTVVDPGVGTHRQAVAVQADGRWFVGPDNGLLSVLAARATAVKRYRITWQPAQASATFAGRDLFAPVCAWLAARRSIEDYLSPVDALEVKFDPAELPRVIYIDHFGNAWTGIRAGLLGAQDGLRVGAHTLSSARTFAEVEKGAAFWLVNSVGLVEIAANRASAAQLLGLAVGDRVQLLPGTAVVLS